MLIKGILLCQTTTWADDECVKNHWTEVALAVVSRRLFPAMKLPRIYPQVLKRVLHIVVRANERVTSEVAMDNCLNLHGIKKRLGNG